jgi:hypothetical protein
MSSDRYINPVPPDHEGVLTIRPHRSAAPLMSKTSLDTILRQFYPRRNLTAHCIDIYLNIVLSLPFLSSK